MISSINQIRSLSGKGPVGFLNPLLYESGNAIYKSYPTSAVTNAPSADPYYRYLRRSFVPSKDDTTRMVSNSSDSSMVSSGLFIDITQGSNNCCGLYSATEYSTGPVCCDDGFQATVGWDAVSGT